MSNGTPAVGNTPDTAPPVLVIEGADAPEVDGNRLVLHYTDANDLGAIGPDGSAFTVLVGNTVNVVTGVAVDVAAKTVTLTLATTVVQGQTVTLSYTDPGAANDPRAIQDAAGNDAASIPTRSVTNNTPEATPPMLVTQGIDIPRVDGARLVLYYTDTSKLATGAAAPLATSFTVGVDKVATAVTAVNVVGKTVQLTLATPVRHGQAVTVSYTDPSSRDDIEAIQDAAGNDAASFTGLTVANGTPPPVAPVAPPGPDITPPVLDRMTVDGNQLVLRYTEANRLDTRNKPANDDFNVRVGGAANGVTNVAVDADAKTVTLTLTRPVPQGAAVTLSYYNSHGIMNQQLIRDEAGNRADGILNQDVNNLTDSTPPALVTEGANAPRVDGNRLVLNYTDTNSLSATGPLAAAFTVRAGETANTVTGVVVDAVAKTVTLTLANAVEHGQAVTVGYNDPAADNDANAIQDAAGNDAATFAPRTVINNTPETSPPELVTTGQNAPKANGQQLVLHYTDANPLGATGPAADAFAVRVDGVVNTVTSVAVDAVLKTVTLTLATAVTPGQAITFSYTDPTSRDDAAAIQDAAGNDAATITNQPVTNITPDTTPPLLVTTGANAPTVNGSQLVLHYTDTSDLGATGPADSAFTVRVNGAVVNNAVAGVTVNPTAKTVTLTLVTAVTAGQDVRISYTDPSPGNDASAIQDAADNDAASFPDQSVTNTTPASAADTTPPALVAEGADAPAVNGTRLVLHYTDANNLGAAGPAAADFAVLVNDAPNVVANAVVDPVAKIVILTLTTAVTPGQTVRISYTDPSAGNDPRAIQDAAGNDAVSFAGQLVTNNSTAPTTPTTPVTPPPTDNTPPVLEGATINGDRLVLTYTDANNLGAGAAAPRPDAFTVRVKGHEVAVSSVTVTGKTVTLILAAPVWPGQPVTVSYTDPSAANDPSAIQDAAGNDAISLTDQLVTNNTTVTPTEPDPVTPDTPTTPVTPPPTDTAPPVLESATIKGDRLVLTYTDANNLGAGAAAPRLDAFTVRVKGHEVAVSSVTVTGKTVTLILAASVWPGQPVTVSYTDPSAANDPSAIQDAAGNDAASLTDQLVTNNTTVTPTEPDPVTPVTPPVKPVTPSPESPPTPPTTVTPSPTPATPPSTSPRTLAPDDNDSVPGIEEDKIPGITGPGGAAPLAGDGNGDGIKDSQQSAVASMNGMTLVAGSHDGKPLADSSVRITSMEQQAAPANVPKGLEMPMGLLRFETTLAAGSLESFSLYVDPTRGVNGYWVRDDTGVWVNLASEPHGGKTVTEGNRLRLDFKITDGGAFDADGKADGLITALGAAGHAQLSIVGQTPDLAQGGFWF